MDNIQRLLKEMKCKVPDCTASRQRLKSILSDYIPTEKQKINSILNAYDEGVENRINSSSDKTLTALQFIKILKDDYGMTEDNAFWSIETWCYILGIDEIADALLNITPNAQQATSQTKQALKAEYRLGMGIYKAGVDFPSGEICITVDKKPRLNVFYGKSKSPNKIQTNDSFMDKVYLRIEDGEYLKLFSYETGKNYTYIVTKAD